MSESVAPEAFNNTISDDIRCLTDHDTRLVLGRTSAHTFEVRVDAHGLWGRALINPNDLDAVNTKARVDRGDINQASFGFDIVKEDTDIREDGSVHFTIREVKLYECSVVAFPAYAETNISSRARDAELAKERAKKAEEQKQPAPPKTTEFSVTAFDDGKVSLALLDDLRKITNNIFNLKYIQKEPADDKRESAVYETFVTDASGQIISNIVNISADKSGNDLVHKVTYTLSSHTKFPKTETYFVILRYKGSDTNVVMKAPCKIVIEFASDFDF